MNGNKRTLKGFSLIELIIVLAIFSLIMLGAINMFDPVQRIFKNASISEKTYSYTNNIQAELQSRLEYADNVRIYDSATINGGNPASQLALRNICEDMRVDYYADVVRTHDGTNIEYIDDANIYILHLLNNDSGTIPAGQITERAVPFSTDMSATLAEVDVPGEDASQEIINPAFFNARDSVYHFNYAMGNAKMINIAAPAGARSSDTFRALSSDFDNVNVKDQCDFRNLAISIVVSKDVPSGVVGNTDLAGSGGNLYRAFINPTSLSVANIALTNISFRNNSPVSRFYRDNNPGATVPFVRQNYSPMLGAVTDSYINESSENVDFNNDIYIFYTRPEEFE